MENSDDKSSQYLFPNNILTLNNQRVIIINRQYLDKNQYR